MANSSEEQHFEDESEAGDRPAITGMVRELALTGLATLFMTEDSIRKYVKDLKIPKELMGFVADSASKKKDDAYRVIAKELSKFLSNINVSEELVKFLRNHKVNVEAKLSFEPKKPSSE